MLNLEMTPKKKAIKTKIVYLYGKPGAGKTLLATFFASTYPPGRLFSNYEIRRFGKKISRDIKCVDDIGTVKYSEYKGVVVMDEIGLNFNARRSMSNANLEQAKLPILSRKKHVDVLYIAQLEIMGDVYVRDLSEYHIEMLSYFVKGGDLCFKAKIKTSQGELLVIKKVDLIGFLEWSGIEYDTLDEAKMMLGKIEEGEDKIFVHDPEKIETDIVYRKPQKKKFDEKDKIILDNI